MESNCENILERIYPCSFIICIPYLIVRIIQPLLLRKIIINIMNNNQESFLLIYVLIQTILDYQINFHSMSIGVRVLCILTSYIYYTFIIYEINIMAKD